jgi:hypothetical protein
VNTHPAGTPPPRIGEQLVPPFVLVQGDRDPVGALGKELRETGWAVHEGWEVAEPGWSLRGRICLGEINDPADARAAVLGCCSSCWRPAARSTTSPLSTPTPGAPIPGIWPPRARRLQ